MHSEEYAKILNIYSWIYHFINRTTNMYFDIPVLIYILVEVNNYAIICIYVVIYIPQINLA